MQTPIHRHLLSACCIWLSTWGNRWRLSQPSLKKYSPGCIYWIALLCGNLSPLSHRNRYPQKSQSTFSSGHQKRRWMPSLLESSNCSKIFVRQNFTFWHRSDSTQVWSPCCFLWKCHCLEALRTIWFQGWVFHRPNAKECYPKRFSSLLLLWS